MIKFIFKAVFILILLALGLGAYGLYSARALPNWFDPDSAESDYVAKTISQELGRGGAAMLADKSVQILRGQVEFSEAEFNALVLASLKSDRNGRKLLQVSDGVRAFLHSGEVELAAVINIEKLGKLEPKAREAVEKFDKLFWIIKDGRVAISVFGEPVVQRGGLGVKPSFRAKVGEIDFSNQTLRSLKVPVENAKQTQLDIDYLTLKTVSVDDDVIKLGVRARI